MQTNKQKYNNQKTHAKLRGIDWQFTYESWLIWWGDDLVNRGKNPDQLCMARFNDTGPYHPDNVRKATTSENSSEAASNLIRSVESNAKRSQTLKGRASSWTSKKIQTPLGIFNSRKEAAQALGVRPVVITHRVKTQPEQYRYLVVKL